MKVTWSLARAGKFEPVIEQQRLVPLTDSFSFKCLICRQQDASEFLEHFLNLFEEKSKSMYKTPATDLSRHFRFSTVTRTEAATGVKYETTKGQTVLRLTIPQHMLCKLGTHNSNTAQRLNILTGCIILFQMLTCL